MPDTHDSTAELRSLAVRERAALAALFDEVGPAAPTLCTGWVTRDLAAHLVVREGHPAAVGLLIRPLAGWTARQQRRTASMDYSSLVERFRQGPPVISPMRVPGADSAANTFEHFVHHEDVRRAAPTWAPRLLDHQDQKTLWRLLSRRLRVYVRRSPVPVRFEAPGFGDLSVGNTDEPSTVSLSGTPAELVLYVHGRRDHTKVDFEGPDDSIRRWLQLSLEV